MRQHLTDALIAVSRETLVRAESRIHGCEACSRKAGLPFSWILDYVTDRSTATTDYVLPRPARCRRCGAEVLEKTLVET